MERIEWDEQGLVPVIVQDARTSEVLMLAYANAEALARTLESSEAHFWSRSRQALWRKGETSGHTQRVLEVRCDCDADVLLYLVEPRGPACHTGERTCFFRTLAKPGDAGPEEERFGIPELVALLRDRKEHPREGSYTCSLLAAGENLILKKVAEEAVEVVIAAKGEGHERLISEVADLVYHVLVLLLQQDIGWPEVEAELARRHQAPRKSNAPKESG